jgi:hypothetical protein
MMTVAHLSSILRSSDRLIPVPSPSGWSSAIVPGLPLHYLKCNSVRSECLLESVMSRNGMVGRVSVSIVADTHAPASMPPTSKLSTYTECSLSCFLRSTLALLSSMTRSHCESGQFFQTPKRETGKVTVLQRFAHEYGTFSDSCSPNPVFDNSIAERFM